MQFDISINAIGRRRAQSGGHAGGSARRANGATDQIDSLEISNEYRRELIHKGVLDFLLKMTDWSVMIPKWLLQKKSPRRGQRHGR
jgi:hypothetical protein